MELVQSTLSASFIDKGARQLLLNLLGRLEHGQLLLRDGGERHSFGVAGTDLHVELVVQDPAFYHRLLLGGSIAAGETWVEGLWTSPDPVALVRLLARNLPLLDSLERRLGWLSFPFNKVRHWLNRNTLTGSRSNIAAHYDLGNTLYQGFLDSHMQYSSAIYPSAGATLEEGQQAKLRTICERLELGPDDHLLEIGTGWGGLAVYAARHYGCRVTTTTISRAQHDYAKEWIAREGLGDRITLLLEDYRKLEGTYDKLVSIEMIEAVGHAFLPDYFRQLSRLLKPGGRLLIQAITIADQRHAQYLRGVDFIQRYIFPGGCLPSVSQMAGLLARETDMQLVRLHDHGHHYARTLADWCERFLALAPELPALGYSQDFIRLWHFYFAYCEGGFWERTISLVQLEAAKPGPLGWSGDLPVGGR
ncbi:SAM-dependent methyltransferase [Aeromonas hydrophila]|uniref:SAM-dependent methyltransferase n=1 Tax=Aeromonas hydrophila TaxID=644 RepID=UPI000C760DDF|nr:cyclopropane-fatty-acyl-phospholipid synthase family protein [Aeromonas hydrophila]AWA05569.1 class I SAM-dependent methyltransferase [Aeromonas hydrophila subsp. hydrophila]